MCYSCNTYYYTTRMRSIMTMSIPASMRKELVALARKEHVSRSHVIQKALNEFLMRREFRRIRAKMIGEASKKGVFTDEDIFKMVS